MQKEEIILNHIKHRRSIFPASYNTKEIARQDLFEIIQAATYAPTHKLTQPWRFMVFNGAGLIKLADLMANFYKKNTPPDQFLQKKYDVTKEKILRSAAVIAINIHYSGLVPKWEEVAAVGAAVQNLWLAAAAKEIGGYWSTPNSIKNLKEPFKLSANEECLGLFYLGYHQEKDREALREPTETKIIWVEE
ncbi:nitroreductase [Olivibacter sp. SDN3]|uniref:nitroreductase family protein n=1 Tax=Olivibacter sp. SDN3 TaxID=2764720 RepID=UPI0016515578|nr:nitroreductase [Olivibacter sp. SDN3]QNL51174.1 nitroreductase [Olivibacter sp. SDN3]